MFNNVTALRPQSRLDLKWLKTDLQVVFRTNGGIDSLWNGLIKDGEVVGSFSDGLVNSAGVISRKGEFGKYYCGLKVLTCACCDGICGPHTGCNCLSCQKIDAEVAEQKNEKPPLPSPNFLLDLWMWGPQPTQEQLGSFISSLNFEQQKVCSEAASTSLSSTRLHQRLTVFRRYFIALNRYSSNEQHSDRKFSSECSEIKTVSNKNTTKQKIISSTNPVMGLAQVGSRAALNFSFAFLKKAWRLGEDIDICSDLLRESLEALQLLPVATLFDEPSASPIWLEIVERSSKFLRQVVTGDVTSGRQYCEVPLEDQHTSLNILLELALQRGTLSSILDAVLLLLNIWEKQTCLDDNRSGTHVASAPLLPFLKRFESIPCNATQIVKKEKNVSLNCNGMYRKLQQLPQDDLVEIDLRQAALMLMSHLDRLATPNIPSQSFNKLSFNTNKQEVWGWGFLPWAMTGGPHICEALNELSVKQLCCSERLLLILTRNGKVYTMNFNSEFPCPQLVEGLKDKEIIKISTHIEGKHFMVLTKEKLVYSWGNGDNGRLGHGDTLPKDEPTLIETLKDIEIIDIQCGETYSAAISSNGALYSWGRGNYGRLGHGKSTDCSVPTAVSTLSEQKVVKVACGSGDSHTLCITDQGQVYSWGDGDYGKLGRGGSDGSNVPLLIDSLQDIEISEVYCGAQFSMALTKDGSVYSWGKGEGWRLGHYSEEHVRFPKIIEALQGKRIVSISMGLGHTIALTEGGELYGWGKNDSKQVYNNSNLCVHQPVMIHQYEGNEILGICCGPTQSFVWTDFNTLITNIRIPFVTDLSENTFRLLDQLLAIICENSKQTISNFPMSQDKECIAISTLNLLQLQLHCIITNNLDVKPLGLSLGSKLLNNLKSKVVHLASASGILSTIQLAAQTTLQTGWRILLPTANERAHTLSSFLPNTGLVDSCISTGGHRFMTDLLVWSLMTDGGLETSLCEALRIEIAELADSEETFEILVTRSTIPLLHLIKQLLKNVSLHTQLCLQEFNTTNKLPSQKHVGGPSFNLLLRFQRLLVAKIYMKDHNCLKAAESLLQKYLHELTTHATDTINYAYEIAITNPKNFVYVLEVLKGDIVDVLLPEIIVSLILLQKEIKLFLITMDWLRIFDELLLTLDKFCRLIPNMEAIDTDDVAWPGLLQSHTNHYLHKIHEDLPLIRKADLENHNLDGGLWTIINNKVYDVQDYKCDNSNIMELLQKHAGKDASHIFNSSPYNLTILQSMDAYIVGNYSQPELELPQVPLDSLGIASTLLDTERHLGYLLGLHSFYVRNSLPLQHAETASRTWLNAQFLTAGLQLMQQPNPYKEEKGEVRSTNSTAGNTPTEPKANLSQKSNKTWQTIFERVNSFINALAESRLSDSYVIAFLAIVEQHSKQNNFLTRVDFSFEHPVEEIGRILYAVLLKHLGLGYILLPILDAYISKPIFKLPTCLTEMIKQVHSAKWHLIKIRQELNRSYKEVCIPVLEKCRFLLYEVKPTISLEMEAYKNLNVLYREPRIKTLIKKVMKDLKCGHHIADMQKPEDIVNATIQSQSLERHKSNEDIVKLKRCASDGKVSESKSETDDVNNEIKNASDKSTNECKATSESYKLNSSSKLTNDQRQPKNCTDLKTELEDKLNVEKLENETKIEPNEEEKQKKLDSEIYLGNILSKIMEKKMKKINNNNLGLMNSILDFLAHDTTCDIDVLRKAMYCQVKRYRIRKEGLVLIKHLLNKTYLLTSTKYSILNGYLGCTSESLENNFTNYHCLDNIQLIAPYLKTDMLLAQMSVTQWCIDSMRTYLTKDLPMRPNKLKLQNAKINLNLGTYTLLRDIPRARILLSLLGVLASNYYVGTELSSLINSGVVSSNLTLLRQTGYDQTILRRASECYVLYANVLDSSKPKRGSLTGAEIAGLLKLGTHVIRGADWKWGDQDGPPPGIGRIISELAEDGWIRVEWSNGTTNSYRMGKEDKYDLGLASPQSPVSSDITEAEQSEAMQLSKDNQFIKLLRDATINFLRVIMVSSGLAKRQLHPTSVHGLSRLFCNTIRSGNQDWCSLNLMRIMAQTPQLCRAFSTKPWIDLLLSFISPTNIVGGNEMNLPKQIQALRLLKIVLQSWDMDNSDISPLLEKLLVILGTITLTCCYDVSNKPLPESKTLVLLTQSHSHTLAQEIINLLRNLYGLVGWNQILNSILFQKLNVAAYLLSVTCLMSNSTDNVISEQQYLVTACLNVIGAYDSRPRVGAIVEMDSGLGTIVRVTQTGKLCVQLHITGETKKVSFNNLNLLVDNQFNLDRMPLSENLVKIWATLLINKYNISSNSYERKSSHGQIDIAYLRTQQNILSALNATRVLYSNQYKLRKILKYPANCLEQYQEQSIEEEVNQQPILLIQKILTKAIQPSPLKPSFNLQEMQLAALNLSQYLATECNLEKTSPEINNDKNNDKTVVQPVFRDANSELTTPNSECSFKSVISERKRKKDDSNQSSPSPLVMQIMEMGFSKKSIENAIKSIGIIPETLLTPESIISWLLEHPDVQVSDTDSLSSYCDSDTESITDPNEVTPYSAGECSGDNLVCNVSYMQRSDFLSNDEYAMYIRDNVEVGMLVRCCKSYEEVHIGDIGKVIKIDREGLHDLNLQVSWQHRVNTYWVRFIHIELLGFPPSLTTPAGIKIGDKVRVKPSIATPRYKWGYVTHDSVGMVTSISPNGHDVTIDYPKQANWIGLISEMEIVPSSHEGIICNGCGIAPIKGARFKCKVCENFDFCENCFYTKKNHRHSFNRLLEPDSLPIFAGKPGRYFRNDCVETEGLILDWNECVKNVTISSREHDARFDIPDGLWQSCGTQGQHWIRLEMRPEVTVKSLSVLVDPTDNSYMPLVIVVSGGTTVSSLSELAVINVRSIDTTVNLLSNVEHYYPLIEIAVVKCRNGGIDCKIHGISLVGVKKLNRSELKTSISFLANDWDLNHEVTASVPYIAQESCSSKGNEYSVDGSSCRVFVWGLNDKDQLGGMKGSKVKLPMQSDFLSQLRPIHIAGGSKSLFVVSQDGKLYACGEGTNGKLGLGHNNNVCYPRQIPFLSQYVIKKVAVHSGGKHTLALTLDGKVFSWGEGDDGKLGHGNRLNLDKPKMIESLRSKRIRDIACGSSHSAAITSSGELYTWGLGEYGRLGHGDNITQLRPKLVQTLIGHRIIQVACGSRDAQTLALSDEGLVFSWGDGDFGKLGRGGSEGCNVPYNIERLNHLSVTQVECGAQFSLALTKAGEVWTWGKGDYFRLGHGTDQHVRKPTMIEVFRDKKIVQIAVGALHCLAVTDCGQVYAWGDNDHGQQGNGTTIVNRKPALVHGLEDVFINRVACGSSHSIAWILQLNPVIYKHEPVIFSVSKDPLGSASLGLYDDEKPIKNNHSSKDGPTLSGIVMSLDSSASKQQALQHILNAMHIHQLRQAVVRSLCSHTNLQASSTNNFTFAISPDTPPEGANGNYDQRSKDGDIICGGGEAPASLTEISDFNSRLTTPENEENPLALFQSMTASSCSASLSSKHSLKSTSAMSVIAATMTSHAEVVGEGNITGLDEFTSLLTESDARLLVDLLKLAVAERVEDTHATEIISIVLINMGCANKNIGAMLLEICVTELEDTVSNNHTSTMLPRPVVQESSHPYIDDVTLKGHVRLPGADSLRIEFDRRCSTERRHDPLQITDGTGRVIATRSGREWTDWSSEVRIAGDEFHWTFTSDSSVNGWGWKFKVFPIMCSQNLKEVGSDRAVLSQPSMDMVMNLLDSQLFNCGNSTLISRLATALAGCSQLSYLSSSQRMWALQRLHKLLMLQTTKEAILGLPIQQLRSPSGVLANLFEDLPQALLRQYEYEEVSVRSGVHLVHSDFFQILATLACDLELDKMIVLSDNHKWSWFRRYCYAARVVKSFIQRSTLPKNFTQEVRKKLGIASMDSNDEIFEHESFNAFKKEQDEQLLVWLNRRPEDWTLSWGGSGLIYGWGHNHRGQLGGVEGAKIKIPSSCDALSILRPIQIVGGEQTLLAVTADGKVYATGYGAGGRLGIGGTDSVLVPTLIESFQHVFIKKVAVNSGGKHCLALSVENDVYSWGEGDDGKLGHGNRDGCETPQIVEALQGLEVIDIACGGAHSAAITGSGHLYTWGKGRYGRLGHGDSEDQLKPKRVDVLLGYNVIDVACGSGDAQTLCITDDDNVWSWGDGDYGKLGRGGADGCKVPIKIESLAGLGVIKVECGSQFSVALTRSGSIYTWGKGDYHRLGHGTDEHIRRPKKVIALQGKRIISIATGSLHCVACSDDGDVFTWGDNDEGQLGDGTTAAIQRPRLVQALQGTKITHVACGSAHTLAWSVNNGNISGKLPTQIPLEHDLLCDFSMIVLHRRLVLLHHLSELICPLIAMFPYAGPGSLSELRNILVYSIKEATFKKIIQSTMVRDKQHGPVIELNRIQVKRTRKSGGLAGPDGMKSVFGQMVSKLPLLTTEILSLPQRIWKVKFVGESVDDCGGGYNESIAEMCDELQNGSLPLLIPTPNGRDEAGTNRDCFLLNPNSKSCLQLNMFRFLGVLMGIAIRTGSPLSLNLAEPMWKLIAGMELTPCDLTEMDRDYVPGLLCIRDMTTDEQVFQNLEMPFSTPSSCGTDVPLSNKYKHITYENRLEYVRLALNFRLHEFDEQVKAVRDGLSRVVCVPLLSLFSAYELETMVCGSPDIPLCLLKKVATYKGVEANSSLMQWFWEVMEEFTNQERSLFLRFVWGRTRLPRTIADFRGRDFVIQVLDKYHPPDHFLPESYTCFFLLKMPRYSCKMVLQEKLKYAIHFCKSIDTDEYARVAMVGDMAASSSSDAESDPEMDSIASHEPL